MQMRIFNAIKKYLFKDTKYFFIYSLKLLQGNYKENCIFGNTEDLINEIKKGKSLIRIGDGEIGLIHYLPIHYQKFSEGIRSDFIDIIKSYNNESSYVLMIPLFLNITNKELEIRKTNLSKCWMPLKITYRMLFNKNSTYYDAHLFYRDNTIMDLIFSNIKEKEMIIVTNQENIDIIKNTFLDEKVSHYIKSTPSDAYEYRFNIENEIKNYINKNNKNISNYIIIMAAGLSKTIIKKMSEEGYQLLDIGKGLEGYAQKINLEKLI